MYKRQEFIPEPDERRQVGFPRFDIFRVHVVIGGRADIFVAQPQQQKMCIRDSGNVGPGFGQVGAMDNFSSVPGVFKISSSLLMLLGRLEIFGLIQLFFIKWWR